VDGWREAGGKAGCGSRKSPAAGLLHRHRGAEPAPAAGSTRCLPAGTSPPAAGAGHRESPSPSTDTAKHTLCHRASTRHRPELPRPGKHHLQREIQTGQEQSTKDGLLLFFFLLLFPLFPRPAEHSERTEELLMLALSKSDSSRSSSSLCRGQKPSTRSPSAGIPAVTPRERRSAAEQTPPRPRQTRVGSSTGGWAPRAPSFPQGSTRAAGTAAGRARSWHRPTGPGSVLPGAGKPGALLSGRCRGQTAHQHRSGLPPPPEGDHLAPLSAAAARPGHSAVKEPSLSKSPSTFETRKSTWQVPDEAGSGLPRQPAVTMSREHGAAGQAQRKGPASRRHQPAATPRCCDNAVVGAETQNRECGGTTPCSQPWAVRGPPSSTAPCLPRPRFSL